jgi:hypothetical protein
MFLYKMNFSAKLLVAGFLLFLIGILLIINSQNYIIPSNDSSINVNSYSTEGFSGSSKPIEYTSYPSNKSMDFNNNKDIVPSNEQCFKIKGQNGLVCSPSSPTTNNPTDTFSQSSGSPDCQSYGLMNSKGYVCLNENQKKLYTTRGGNAT